MIADPFLDSGPGGVRPLRLGDVVRLYDGGHPMTVVAEHGRAMVGVSWHDHSGKLHETLFESSALLRCHSYALHHDVAHDRAVELAEAGATKVTFGTGWGPVIFLVGVFVGFVVAVARGAAP